MSGWICQIDFQTMTQSVERPPAWTLIRINTSNAENDFKIMKSAKVSKTMNSKYLHLVIFIRSIWCSYPCYLTDARSNCNFHIIIRMSKKLLCNQCFEWWRECILHWLARWLFHPYKTILNLLHLKGIEKSKRSSSM